MNFFDGWFFRKILTQWWDQSIDFNRVLINARFPGGPTFKGISEPDHLYVDVRNIRFVRSYRSTEFNKLVSENKQTKNDQRESNRFDRTL